MPSNPRSGPRQDDSAPPTGFDPAPPPRQRRPLRAPAPEVTAVAAADGVPLRLTRFRAGDRGPVMLAHGLGVSSRIFSLDTIETNLVEFLCAHGFDVWLLDGRTSIELESAANPASADEVARLDYPAAVDAIRAATGARDLQVIAHCFGGTTLTMALLAGLQGVRSAVISQVSAHVETSAFTRVKAAAHLTTVLSALGIRSASAFAGARRPWYERLVDRALRWWPLPAEERCASDTCRRITFMYAPLYEHDQINPLTHECLHELFGVANIRAFAHLARIVKAGHVVAADGSDAYLPHLDRMAMPITFIHGAENECYLPASTERTMAALTARNGARYRRFVIPDYAHIDCIFGKSAARDVYPLILDHLTDS